MSKLNLAIRNKINSFKNMGTNHLIHKPIKSITSIERNKTIAETLKSRSIVENKKNYTRNRTKEVNSKLRELNKELKSNEFFYFDGKKINKFNLNILELRNIHKLLTHEDKRELMGITADISLRIGKEIRQEKIEFVNSFGQVENMTPNYLLSLPLDKLKTIITDYEYKKLFNIVKRIPEKNINYIQEHYKEVQDIQTKNKYILTANVLLKVGLAKIKGIITDVKEDFAAKRGNLLVKKINIEEYVARKFKLFDKYYKSGHKNLSTRNLTLGEIYRFHSIEYFERMELLLSKYVSKHKTMPPKNIMPNIENMVTDSVQMNYSKSSLLKRYNKLLLEQNRKKPTTKVSNNTTNSNQ